jgi:hypothetical protein
MSKRMIIRPIHLIKASFNKVIYFFKLINWARTHSREIKDYKFLVELRDIAYKKKLEAERKEQDDISKKLEIQINLIDKILKYASR